MSDTKSGRMVKGIPLRDYDGAFGLNPSKQNLVGRGAETLRDFLDGLVYGTTRLARDRAMLYMSVRLQASETRAKRKEGGGT